MSSGVFAGATLLPTKGKGPSIAATQPHEDGILVPGFVESEQVILSGNNLDIKVGTIVDRTFDQGEASTEGDVSLKNIIRRLELEIAHLREVIKDLQEADPTENKKAISKLIDEVSRLKRKHALELERNGESEKLAAEKEKYRDMEKQYLEQIVKTEELTDKNRALWEEIDQLREQLQEGFLLKADGCCVVL
ncbi:MAG: hypothetical protein JXA94_03860 [Parachlamydiales bacterium]|nr:hypothetical protein [Parachlamydiales bacterium]